MVLLLAALLVLIGLQAPAPTGTASLEGLVTRAGTSQPIQNARVAIWGDRGPDFQATTDGNGRFVVSNMPAGIFNIQVLAEGYLPNPLPNLVVRIGLNDRQRLRHDVVLLAVSSISGRIVDDIDDPLAGITVEILRQSRDLTGRVAWQGVASAVTDHKGSYRFDDLRPGDFYVRASRKPELTVTYFAGTLDPRAAAPISLRDGDARTADFSLTKGKTFSIAGTVKNADESPLRQVTLFVVPQDSSIPLDEFFTTGVSVNEKFELKGLLPGAYDLFAVSLPVRPARTTVRINTNGGEATIISPERIDIPMRGAKGFVQIRDEDVRDISFLLETGGNVSGHIKIVGKNAPSPPVRLVLKRRDDFLSGMARAGVLEPPDSFRFSDTVPGVYDVSAVIQDGNAYVSDVRVFGRSIVDEGLTIGHDPVDSLEILIELEGGTVKGSITSTRKSPVVVVLAPQGSRRKAHDLFRAEGLGDPAQPFTFSGVPPGLYSLFAFELTSIDEVLPFLSPDFLALYQNRSTPISVEKGATVTTAPLSLISR
jgi:hypothetical protein